MTVVRAAEDAKITTLAEAIAKQDSAYTAADVSRWMNRSLSEDGTGIFVHVLHDSSPFSVTISPGGGNGLPLGSTTLTPGDLRAEEDVDEIVIVYIVFDGTAEEYTVDTAAYVDHVTVATRGGLVADRYRLAGSRKAVTFSASSPPSADGELDRD